MAAVDPFCKGLICTKSLKSMSPGREGICLLLVGSHASDQDPPTCWFHCRASLAEETAGLQPAPNVSENGLQYTAQCSW